MDVIATVPELFVDHSLRRIFAYTGDGTVGLLSPQPLLLRTVYSRSDEIEQAIPKFRAEQSASHPNLLICFLSSSDDHRFRTAKVFQRQGQSQVNFRDTAGNIHHLNPSHYFVTGGGHPWSEDLRKGIPGVFITGDYGPTSVWRVFRLDCDAFQFSVVTLTPLVITYGFPPLDLSSIPDFHRREEITTLYEELQGCVLNQTYRSAITKAKDMVEALLPLKANVSPSRTLADTLEKVEKQIKDKQSKVSWLTYHMCQQLRHQHGGTHPGRAYKNPIMPELALAAVQNLVEILRQWGYVRPS